MLEHLRYLIVDIELHNIMDGVALFASLLALVHNNFLTFFRITEIKFHSKLQKLNLIFLITLHIIHYNQQFLYNLTCLSVEQWVTQCIKSVNAYQLLFWREIMFKSVVLKISQHWLASINSAKSVSTTKQWNY